MIIGLTGLFCSGKSTVEDILREEYDFFIIDVDRIGHWALSEKKSEIINNFGPEILTGSDIDRAKLSGIVFNDKKKLGLLNSIVHPVMVKKVKNEINDSQNKNILINAALLFEMGLFVFCPVILIVKAPLTQIIKRAKARSGYNFIQTIKILFCQKVLTLAKKNKKKADIFYVNNNKSIDELKVRIKSIFNERI